MKNFEAGSTAGLPGYVNELVTEDLDEIFDNPEHDANDVLKLFYRNFGQLYVSSTGTIESYSLGRHTRMVLDQYFKYFKGKKLPVVSEKFFESLLALHDIGKPYAAIEDDLNKQYEYTTKILNDTLPEMGFSKFEIKLALSLVDGDPIRTYLYKPEDNLDEVAEDIKLRAAKAEVDINDFWELLKTYWTVDAASYTEDAGGNASLDRMFEFEPDEGEMSLAPHVAERLDRLELAIFSET